MAIQIAVIGAAGKMGSRISNSLKRLSDYTVSYVEGNDAGREKIRERGDEPSDLDVAAKAADVLILAVPDRLIKAIAPLAVERMRAGSLLLCLDPAAPHAGVIPPREDISIFVCHPAHPSVFNAETDMEARFDFFGSGKASQAIVCALMRGPESDYELGESIAKAMWNPVLRSHRVTVEQMAILEPVLSETVAATCLTIIREAMDEAIHRGVPEEAAKDFLLGHLFCELGILFDQTEFCFSDGALMAVAEGKKKIIQSDWKKVFHPESLQESVMKITGH